MKFMKLLPLAVVPVLALGQAQANGLAIEIASVETAAGVTTVTGTVTAPELGEESVLGEFGEVVRFNPADDEAWPAEVAQATGIDLVNAYIGPIDGGLRFTWEVSSLPGTVIPEGVRYNWSFTVGGQAYQLQAKSMNLASITTAEAPQEHVEQAAAGENFFQIRGNCETNYRGTPVSGCYHLAFLDGGMDPDTGRVWIDLPYGDSRWADIVSGSVINEAQNAGMSIAASYQAVVSNQTVSAFINGWTRYATTPMVALATQSSANFPEGAFYRYPATLDGTSWSAQIPDVGTNVVLARICHGVNCAYDAS